MSTQVTATAQDYFNEAVIGLARGRKHTDLVADFVQRGVPPQAAEAVVGQAHAVKSQAVRRSGVALFFTGLGMILLGVVVNAALHEAKAGFINIGLFAVGGLNALRGLGRMAIG